MSRLEDDPIEAAERLGLRVVEPEHEEVFVDLDSPEALAEYEIRLGRMVGAGVAIREFLRLPSKTEGHWHVYLRLNRDVTDEMRVAIQAALGSDSVREILSIGRMILATERAPSLFFESEENWARLQEARTKPEPEPESDPIFLEEAIKAFAEPAAPEWPERNVPMMACGHAANATCEGKPACAICFAVGDHPEKAVTVVPGPELAGRTAHCNYGRHAPAPSSTSLPFFKHQPGSAFDEYYCGCLGWD